MKCPYCNKQINPYNFRVYRNLHYCTDCVEPRKNDDAENEKREAEEISRRESNKRQIH